MTFILGPSCRYGLWFAGFPAAVFAILAVVVQESLMWLQYLLLVVAHAHTAVGVLTASDVFNDSGVSAIVDVPGAADVPAVAAIPTVVPDASCTAAVSLSGVNLPGVPTVVNIPSSTDVSAGFDNPAVVGVCCFPAVVGFPAVAGLHSW
jgi:hypothetical protein